MTKSAPKKTKVAYVLCYRDPNYIRSLVLIRALRRLDTIDLVVVKNQHRGLLRYIEVPLRLAWVRLTKQPNIFIVGFRGHEVFWSLYPSMVGKRIIFDEFINLHDWLVNEHQKLKTGSFAVKRLDAYMKWVHRKSSIILTDTMAHAELSARIYGTNPKKVKVIPVGADEANFLPSGSTPKSDDFEVLFYGSMLPLHGVEVILEAIRLLKSTGKIKQMSFKLVGGTGQDQKRLNDFVRANDLEQRIKLSSWIDYQKLPLAIEASSLGLGGPFGNTGQAQRVITGKTYQFLAMGRPVVVGKIGGMEGFKNKNNCLIVEQGSALELAEALEWAYNNQRQLERIGKQARKLYENQFSETVQSQILDGILKDLQS